MTWRVMVRRFQNEQEMIYSVGHPHEAEAQTEANWLKTNGHWVCPSGHAHTEPYATWVEQESN